MIINLKVRIKAGPRTPTTVNVDMFSVNEKTIKFANGNTVSEGNICAWLETELIAKLKSLANPLDGRN